MVSHRIIPQKERCKKENKYWIHGIFLQQRAWMLERSRDDSCTYQYIILLSVSPASQKGEGGIFHLIMTSTKLKQTVIQKKEHTENISFTFLSAFCVCVCHNCETSRSLKHCVNQENCLLQQCLKKQIKGNRIWLLDRGTLTEASIFNLCFISEAGTSQAAKRQVQLWGRSIVCKMVNCNFSSHFVLQFLIQSPGICNVVVNLYHPALWLWILCWTNNPSCFIEKETVVDFKMCNNNLWLHPFDLGQLTKLEVCLWLRELINQRERRQIH